MAGWGRIVGGIILLVVGIILSGLSNSIVNQCNSFGGQLGSFLDTSNQETCSIGSFLLIVGIFLAIIGIVLIILGSFSKTKTQKNRGSGNEKQADLTKWYCRFCGTSILQKGDFCPNCGKSLSSRTDSDQTKKCMECGSTMSQDSRYCVNCGNSFSNSKVTPTEKEEQNTSESVNHVAAERIRKAEKHPTHTSIFSSSRINKRSTWLIIGVAVAVAVAAGVYIYSISVNEQQYNEFSQTYTEPTTPPPSSQVIVKDSFTLEAGYYIYYQFSTPPNAVNVRLTGTVGVTGGIVPHVLLYVMDASQCPPPSGNQLNLQGCNSYYINGYYNDGSSVNIYLPSGATYYLAFSNDAVLGERKVIDASFTLETG